jgi:hypothetical protein
MKPFLATVLMYFFLSNQFAYCQTKTFDKVQFFKDETPFNATIETYWSKLINQKNKEGRVFPAQFKCNLGDSITVSEPVSLVVRGHSRRAYCYLPPVKLSFKKTSTSVMHPLKSIKLVNVCKPNALYEQYLYKEFLCYKIYNLLTDKSFRVRMLKIDYRDSSGNKSAFIENAFLTEDEKDMAKRTDCIEWNAGNLYNEATNRKQMTLVAVFEYMIGNTDWSVPAKHNIKLIQSKADSLSKPFAVPYDFDYSGLVNTEYAVPDAMLNTETVEERVYRGFPRTMEELNETFEIFIQQKENIYALINNSELLASRTKRDMIYYLESFYSIIKKPGDVKKIFIDGARKN